MRIRCIVNSEEVQGNDYIGTFEATINTRLGETLKEYLVMGIMLGEGSLAYLIDDDGFIIARPSPLYEVVNNTLTSAWYFRALKNTDKGYPYREAIWGYYELCFDDNHYEQLVEMEEEARMIYFRRKEELEKLIEIEKLLK